MYAGWWHTLLSKWQPRMSVCKRYMWASKLKIESPTFVFAVHYFWWYITVPNDLFSLKHLKRLENPVTTQPCIRHRNVSCLALLSLEYGQMKLTKSWCFNERFHTRIEQEAIWWYIRNWRQGTTSVTISIRHSTVISDTVKQGTFRGTLSSWFFSVC